MRLSLVPTFHGRPAWVKKDDWHVCVSIHDAYVWRRRAWLRARAKNDRRWIVCYRRWLYAELWWYHEHGLTAPTGQRFQRNGRFIKKAA